MIEINDLCKSYESKKIFDGLSLKLEKHQLYCLMGPSGCGKTTLLRMIAGLEESDSGTITGLEGERISFVFQEDRLMPWLSVKENITYVLEGVEPKERERRLAWVLSLLELEKEQKNSVSKLSGGMKRRVAVARALVYESSLLLMDEPFKGLDDALKWKILTKLQAYWQEKGQTVLWVTHDQQEAQRLGNVISLAG